MYSCLRFLCFLIFIFVSQTNFVSADRIKDLTSLAGIRSNQLVGYGVVVGLAGSGDGNTGITLQSMQSLVARFGITSRLEYYNTELLSSIIERSSNILEVPISSDATVEIAGRSRGTPRIANGLLRRVRDFAQIKSDGSIEMKITKYALEALNVDAHGLDDMDNKILTTLIDKFKGGPVGITTLATAVSENGETIEEVYEPFLIQQGFLVRTPRGREVTERAYIHLGRAINNQGGLF